MALAETIGGFLKEIERLTLALEQAQLALEKAQKQLEYETQGSNKTQRRSLPANAPGFVERAKFQLTLIRTKVAANDTCYEKPKKIAIWENGYHFVTKPQPRINNTESVLTNLSSKIIILCKTCFPRINTTKAAWILGFTLFFCLAPQCRSEWHPTGVARA
ncbi:hypothetical protein [Iodobacter sp.]|uniref:hypothetical protein n=1 Tax=Iodobacter sp. TaxID=1915058 RepID=UPI0025F3D7CA|nr:hypothetical protein [Iodobacter sp.]